MQSSIDWLQGPDSDIINTITNGFAFFMLLIYHFRNRKEDQPRFSVFDVTFVDLNSPSQGWKSRDPQAYRYGSWCSQDPVTEYDILSWRELREQREWERSCAEDVYLLFISIFILHRSFDTPPVFTDDWWPGRLQKYYRSWYTSATSTVHNTASIFITRTLYYML